ncbi:hypothetical protein MTR67_028645 [Solanum verrucosum]|uniref:Ribosomal RNA small subunit methyltransferase NEP1 n=1 Tax=Solanum verrucosum TaxID=315347 RepID=A0AAF0U018_SOLVR|nr:hypothetical protein MTR67_028645 [Solanum verrucosum]
MSGIGSAFAPMHGATSMHISPRGGAYTIAAAHRTAPLSTDQLLVVRTYGEALQSKGEKRKKKEENYDKEEIEESVDDVSTGSAKRVKTQHTASDTEAAERVVDLLAGIPVVSTDQSTKPGVIFISTELPWKLQKLERSVFAMPFFNFHPLTVFCFSFQTYQLLNSDEHSNFLKKNNRNPSDYRPDIAHQAMLAILDSRVNKAGTFSRFFGIMLQLLQKLSITAVGFSHSSDKLVDIQDYVNGISNDMNLVFVVGAMARGKIEKDYVEDYLSISDYPMSAAYCISMITNVVERKWKIL